MSWMQKYAMDAREADLREEILEAGGEVTAENRAVLYHMTTPENAEAIVREQAMYGKEDGIFFSTKPYGQGGYGEAAVRAEIPLELIQIDDDFGDELHLRMPVPARTKIGVRAELVV